MPAPYIRKKTVTRGNFLSLYDRNTKDFALCPTTRAMTQPLQPNPSALDAAKIDALLRLATAPPDEALLGRFFAACTQNDLADPVTPAQRRWVVANLEANGAWQAYWKELETAYGHPVQWPKSDFSLNGLEQGTDARPATRQPARIAPLHTRLARLAMVACFLLLAVYGGLWGLGQSMIPATYSLASIDQFEDVEAVQTRGTTVETPFAQGIKTLRAAHQNTLGLFPHYDTETVEQGIAHLQEAFSVAADAFQRAEAAFFLGKAHLMKDDPFGAHRWLTLSLDQNVADYRAEAQALLAQLSTTME